MNCFVKVAQYSFSGSTPSKFKHKLCCYKQRFQKIATTVVVDKEEIYFCISNHQNFILKYLDNALTDFA